MTWPTFKLLTPEQQSELINKAQQELEEEDEVCES